MKILNLKYKMHRLVNYIFYVGIFIFGFLLGFTVKKIDFSEIVSQVLFIESASAETITTCRDSVNKLSFDDRVGSVNGLTFSISDNVFNIKGLSTSWTQDFYNPIQITLDKTHTFSIFQNGDCDGISPKLSYSYDSSNFYPSIHNSSIVLNSGTYLIQTYFIVDSGVNVDCTIKMQLEEGEQFTSWEKPGSIVCEDDDNFYNFANKIVGDLNKENYWVYDFITVLLISACFTLFILVIGYIVKKIFGG